MNKAFLLGNLGKDPELTTTQSGKLVAKFSLGVADGYGEKKVTYWRLVLDDSENVSHVISDVPLSI